MVKVLIIEDDSSARLVTKLHLRNEYQVVEASDGMEAMELLVQRMQRMQNANLRQNAKNDEFA